MPTVNAMTFQFAGAAGTGCDSQGVSWSRSLTRAGLWVFSQFDFESRIRGGHIFYHIRVSADPIHCHTQGTHVLLAFDQFAVTERANDVLPGGAAIFDERYDIDESVFAGKDVLPLKAPLIEMATEIGGNRVMANTAAVGVLIGLTAFDPKIIERALWENFTKRYPGSRGEDLAKANVNVLRAAVELGETRAGDFDYELQPQPGGDDRILLNGNEAFAMGAIAGGCRFAAGYPMTPSSSILEYMAAHQEDYGIVFKHTEDEIAGILTAIGAAHVGVRALAATSGGGFCLMTEGLGLAGMTETPVVVVNVQRTGPSTGMPTRTEQGDLEFVIHASHGEFPRIVLAPGSLEECFEAGYRSFNLAERYQTPVIVMSDLYQAFAMKSVPRSAIDFEAVEIDRGELVSEAELDGWDHDTVYARHKVTDSGISARALPGHPRSVHMTSGDEHTERGFITESSVVRKQQMDKRMRKEELARTDDMRPPGRYGAEGAEITLVGWGSTKGAIREAVDHLNAMGTSADSLHFADIWPVPDSAKEALESSGRLIAVEQNYVGQLSNVLRSATGIDMDERILKYDGHQIGPDDILRSIEAEVEARV